MPKDTYTSIFTEISNVVNQIKDLRKRAMDVRRRRVEEQDKLKIQKIKNKLGI